MTPALFPGRSETEDRAWFHLKGEVTCVERRWMHAPDGAGGPDQEDHPRRDPPLPGPRARSVRFVFAVAVGRREMGRRIGLEPRVDLGHVGEHGKPAAAGNPADRQTELLLPAANGTDLAPEMI